MHGVVFLFHLWVELATILVGVLLLPRLYPPAGVACQVTEEGHVLHELDNSSRVATSGKGVE